MAANRNASTRKDLNQICTDTNCQSRKEALQQILSLTKELDLNRQRKPPCNRQFIYGQEDRCTPKSPRVCLDGQKAISAPAAQYKTRRIFTPPLVSRGPALNPSRNASNMMTSSDTEAAAPCRKMTRIKRLLQKKKAGVMPTTENRVVKSILKIRPPTPPEGTETPEEPTKAPEDPPKRNAVARRPKKSSAKNKKKGVKKTTTVKKIPIDRTSSPLNILLSPDGEVWP